MNIGSFLITLFLKTVLLPEKFMCIFSPKSRLSETQRKLPQEITFKSHPVYETGGDSQIQKLTDASGDLVMGVERSK